MKNIHDILNQALAPENEPSDWLIQNILAQSKEVTPMKTTHNRRFATAALSCALVLGIGSLTVYAAWNYLKPAQVAEQIGEDALRDAFSGENAIYMNETQSCGGYDVTLLGITSGKSLTEYKYWANDHSVTSGYSEDSMPKEWKDGLIEQNDRTYVVFAIKNESQTPSCGFDGFSIFPVVEGYDYETYSGMFENASGGHQTEQDGVLYFMYECNNLEKYADHAVYMCISDDSPAFSEYSYIYDNASGTLARNEEYEGLNALFSLPLDASKADPDAAKEEVKEYEARQKRLAEEPGKPFAEWIQKAYDFVEQITPENIDAYATPITEEGATLTFAPDNQGRVDISYMFQGNGSRIYIRPEELFEDGKTQAVSSTGASSEGLSSILVEHFTLNEDGTVTLQLYRPNFPD